jgi:hypothetical protein
MMMIKIYILNCTENSKIMRFYQFPKEYPTHVYDDYKSATIPSRNFLKRQKKYLNLGDDADKVNSKKYTESSWAILHVIADIPFQRLCPYHMGHLCTVGIKYG